MNCRKAIIAFLNTRPGGMDISELRGVTPLSELSLRAALSVMASEGRITRIQKGRYTTKRQKRAVPRRVHISAGGMEVPMSRLMAGR